MNRNTVEVFKKREFSEFISTPITFIVQEFKLLAITFIVFVGPIILFNSIFLDYIGIGFTQDIFNILKGGGPIQNYQGTGIPVIIYIINILQTIVMYTVAAVYIKLYLQRGSGNFELADVWNEFILRIGHTILAMFLSIIMMFLGFLVFFIPGLYLSVVFYLFCTVIVFEELNFSNAFSRVFQIIKGNWWTTLGAFIILAILAGIINLIISAVLGLVFSFTGYSGIGYIFSSTIIGLVSVVISSVLGLLPVFLYASFVTDKENPGLMDRISQISDDTDDVNIFEVKEQDDNQNTEDESLIKKEEASKTEDDLGKLLDDQEEKNRFEGEEGDKENDRFKPKF